MKFLLILIMSLSVVAGVTFAPGIIKQHNEQSRINAVSTVVVTTKNHGEVVVYVDQGVIEKITHNGITLKSNEVEKLYISQGDILTFLGNFFNVNSEGEVMNYIAIFPATDSIKFRNYVPNSGYIFENDVITNIEFRN